MERCGFFRSWSRDRYGFLGLEAGLGAEANVDGIMNTLSSGY